eukprot:7287047-Pyramimonas_sp.AAC.1
MGPQRRRLRPRGRRSHARDSAMRDAAPRGRGGRRPWRRQGPSRLRLAADDGDDEMMRMRRQAKGERG